MPNRHSHADSAPACSPAVSGADDTQVYRTTDTPAAHPAQAASSLATRKLGAPFLYVAFMIDEFLWMPQDCPVVNLCQPWQVPTA